MNTNNVINAQNRFDDDLLADPIGHSVKYTGSKIPFAYAKNKSVYVPDPNGETNDAGELKWRQVCLPRYASWPVIVNRFFTEHKILKDKHKAPYIIMARLTPDVKAQPEGSDTPHAFRRLTSIKEQSGAILDVDGGIVSYEDVSKRLKALGWNHVIYTSFSYDPLADDKKHKYRIVIPSDVFETGDYKAFVTGIAEELGLTGNYDAPASQDRSHIMYLPSCPSDMADEALLDTCVDGSLPDSNHYIEAGWVLLGDDGHKVHEGQSNDVCPPPTIEDAEGLLAHTADGYIFDKYYNSLNVDDEKIREKGRSEAAFEFINMLAFICGGHYDTVVEIFKRSEFDKKYGYSVDGALEYSVKKAITDRAGHWYDWNTPRAKGVPEDVKLHPELFLELIDNCYLMEEGKVSYVIDARKKQQFCKSTLAHFHVLHRPYAELTTTPAGNVTKRSISHFWEASLHRKSISHEKYVPGAPRIMETEFGLAHNTYTPPDLAILDTPLDKPLLDSFWWQLEFMFPVESRREHILDYMAWLVQHPDQRCMYALLFISLKTGVGKNLVVEILAKLIGKSNVEVVEPKKFSKGGTDHDGFMYKRVLAYVDEVYVGAGKYDVWNQLKSLITAEDCLINPKGIQAFMAETFTNFIFMSNHLNALPLDDTDRRIDVHIIDGARPSDAHFKRLKAVKMNPKALSELYTFLMRRDLQNFNPNEAPEITADKRKVIESAMSDEALVIRDFLEECPYDFAVMSQVDLYARLSGYDTEKLKPKLLQIEARQQGMAITLGHKRINWGPDREARRKHSVWELRPEAGKPMLENTSVNRARISKVLDSVSDWMVKEEMGVEHDHDITNVTSINRKNEKND